MGNSITMQQSPQIKTETTYKAVEYEGTDTPIWKEIHVTKYNRFGKIVYDFADLFHNMQLTESEYDEEGRHIKTTVRNLLLPDEEPIVIEGGIKLEERPEDNKRRKREITTEKSADGEELKVETIHTYDASGKLETVRTTKYNSWNQEVHSLLKWYNYPNEALSNPFEDPKPTYTHTDENVYGDFDQYGNWHSEKWIETIVKEINGQEVEREEHTNLYQRAITYFDEE